jgi:hypothetical protein
MKRLPCLCVVGALHQFRTSHSGVENRKGIHCLLLEVKVMNMFLVLWELKQASPEGTKTRCATNSQQDAQWTVYMAQHIWQCNNHFLSTNPKPQQDSAEKAISEHTTFIKPVNFWARWNKNMSTFYRPTFTYANACVKTLLETQFKYSWFQTFAVLWTLYSFFWVIHCCLNFICQCFRTHCLLHLHKSTYEDGRDKVFRNIGIENSVTEESPKHKNTSF